MQDAWTVSRGYSPRESSVLSWVLVESCSRQWACPFCQLALLSILSSRTLFASGAWHSSIKILNAFLSSPRTELTQAIPNRAPDTCSQIFKNHQYEMLINLCVPPCWSGGKHLWRGWTRMDLLLQAAQGGCAARWWAVITSKPSH